MKKRLIILLIVAFLIFDYQFVIKPLNKRIRTTKELIKKKSDDYKVLKDLIDEYKEKEKNENNGKEKIVNKNFSLFSFTGRIIEQQKLTINVKSINPLPIEEKDNFYIEKVKLDIEDIPLEKLLKFLSDIEDSNVPVYISEFSMLRNKTDPSLLKVNMAITVIKENG